MLQEWWSRFIHVHCVWYALCALLAFFRWYITNCCIFFKFRPHMYILKLSAVDTYIHACKWPFRATIFAEKHVKARNDGNLTLFWGTYDRNDSNAYINRMTLLLANLSHRLRTDWSTWLEPPRHRCHPLEQHTIRQKKRSTVHSVWCFAAAKTRNQSLF